MLAFDVQTNLNADALVEPASKVEHALAVQAAKDTTPYVPARTGTLSNSTRVKGGTIIYPGPYALYLYHGKVMVDPKTGAAGFLTEDGWKSRFGVKKVLSDRNLKFNDKMHPFAQARWFEASKKVNMEKWETFAGKAMKRELK